MRNSKLDPIQTFVCVVIAFACMAIGFYVAADEAFGDTVAQPAVTNSVPTVVVNKVSSAVLTGKTQLEWPSTKTRHVRGCKHVSSFAKAKHAHCVYLRIGKKYTSSSRDRNGATRTFPASAKKGDRTFYRGNDGKWYNVRGRKLVSTGSPELQAGQFVVVKSFGTATYDVDVNYSVTNTISVPSCSSTSTPPSGTASAVTTVHVVATYVPDAKALALQQIPQSVKDEVSGNATKAAVGNVKCQATPNTVTNPDPCYDCYTPPTLTMKMSSDSQEFNVSIDDAHVAQTYIFIKVQQTAGQQISIDLVPSDGKIVSQVDSDTYYDGPCPSGYACFRALYQSPTYETTVYLEGYASQSDGQYGYGESIFSIVNGGFGNG